MENFALLVFGTTLYSHLTFIEQLKKQIRLRAVTSIDESHIIIAFVAIASRAGTDIEAALQKIPQSSRPVVLVVLHHTFDHYFLAPDSRLCVKRKDVFTVDCLFHEDKGLLRCQHNDNALESVTDHLLSKGASVCQGQQMNRPQPSSQNLQPFLPQKKILLFIVLETMIGMFIGMIIGELGIVAGLFLGMFIGATFGYIIHIRPYRRQQPIDSLSEPLV